MKSAAAFSKLENKYGIVDQPQKVVLPASGPAYGYGYEPKCWQDSEDVCLLSAFIKEFRDYGIYVRQTPEGNPTLVFLPGLKTKEKDPERFSVAEHAWYLLEKARDDLKYLIRKGNLKFQIFRGFEDVY